MKVTRSAGNGDNGCHLGWIETIAKDYECSSAAGQRKVPTNLPGTKLSQVKTKRRIVIHRLD